MVFRGRACRGWGARQAPDTRERTVPVRMGTAGKDNRWLRAVKAGREKQKASLVTDKDSPVLQQVGREAEGPVEDSRESGTLTQAGPRA